MVDESAAGKIRSRIDGYRAGEDPDLSQFCRVLWELLYARLPALTGSRSKVAQHRILESYLVEIGLPASPDLQYIAGPVLWYARERRVVPPAQDEDRGSDSWILDPHLYNEAGKSLEEGRAAFGDWMANALRDLLAEQQ
jgi:hypothetical protein